VRRARTAFVDDLQGYATRKPPNRTDRQDRRARAWARRRPARLALSWRWLTTTTACCARSATCSAPPGFTSRPLRRPRHAPFVGEPREQLCATHLGHAHIEHHTAHVLAIDCVQERLMQGECALRALSAVAKAPLLEPNDLRRAARNFPSTRRTGSWRSIYDATVLDGRHLQQHVTGARRTRIDARCIDAAVIACWRSLAPRARRRRSRHRRSWSRP
jgi:hypothetical protein